MYLPICNEILIPTYFKSISYYYNNYTFFMKTSCVSV